MARLLTIGVAALVTLLSVGSCGSSGSDGTDGSAADGSDTDGGQSGGDGSIEYVPWGPDDPPIPGQYAALAASEDTAPRCDDLAGAQPGGDFWAAAVSVCRALTGEAEWPQTTTVPPLPTAANAYQGCLDEELAAMLQQALQWHADHPGEQPEVNYPDSATRSPCQYRIFDIQVLENNPDENQSGGVPVAVTLSGLDGDYQVSVDGEQVEETSDFPVDDPGDGLDTIVILAPAAAEPRTADVAVTTDAGTVSASVELPAAAASTTTPSTEATTSEPTTEPTDRARPPSRPADETP